EVRRHELEDPALPKALPDEMQLQALQVAEPPVDELRGPRGRPGREVAPLDERDREPTEHGVQGDARSRHPAADDEEVEALVSEVPQGGRAFHLSVVVHIMPACWISWPWPRRYDGWGWVWRR